MLLAVSRIAILAASCIVPRDARAGWRRVWTAELCHYATLLRRRGLKSRYVRARIWHHFAGAMRDAWRLFCETPGFCQLRSAMRTSAFSLGLIALALATIVTASRGLTITRAMLAPPYPEAGRLVLISEGGVLLSERHPIPPPLLDFWKTHTTAFAGLAGYRWDSHGTAWVTPDFFDVLGVRPRRLLLRRIRVWKPLHDQQDLAVLGRLKPGVTAAAAQSELRDLAAGNWRYRQSSPPQEAQVMPLVARIRQPLYAYALVCGVPAVLLLLAACIGMRADRRRIGRIRRRYWAYFCAKSVSLPVALALVIWEFTRATSFTLTSTATFVAKPFFIWLVILACGAIVWWCLADQRARCRACVRTLQYPVRIGSLGAVLFDHAGMELMCCQGHGALYVPAVSSDYVQPGGWTALDADIASDPVPR
jgi:hypothetical protein